MRSLLLLGATCALFSAAPAAVGQIKFPLEQPSVKVGDKAKFRFIDLWSNRETSTGESEVVEVTETQVVTRSTNSASPDARTNYANRQLQPCRSMQGGTVQVCGGSLKFPMSLGDKHSFDKLPWVNGQGYLSEQCEVKAEERVQVPAGTFDTVRIECTGFWTRVFGGSGTGRVVETVWFSPTVGRTIKSEYIAYTTAGKLDVRQRTELVESIK